MSDFIITPEGRAIPDSSGNFTYQYYLKDHLGNTRVTYTQKGELLQDNNYYPFGMSTGEATNYIADACLENKYLYNGKELDDDLGVGWYDYGARFYDPELGRWHSLDPLAEKYSFQSPFVYGANNPIRFIDFMGMYPGEPDEDDPPQQVTEIKESMTNPVLEVFDAIFSGISEAVDNLVTAVSDELVENSDEIIEVMDVAGDIAENTETGGKLTNNKPLKKVAGQLGDGVTVLQVGFDAATTDFSDSEQTADFIENTASEGVETAFGPLGPAVNVILNDSKSENGVTNTKNMSRNFSSTYRTTNAYIHKNFTLRFQQQQKVSEKNKD